MEQSCTDDIDQPWAPHHLAAEQPWETPIQYLARMDREKRFLERIDDALGVPRAEEVRRVLGSEADLEAKKEAVRWFIAYACEVICTPIVSSDDPRVIIFSGAHYSCLASWVNLGQTIEFRRYRRELADGREERRGDRSDEKKTYRAEKWLKALKATPGFDPDKLTPAKRKQVEKRLAIIGMDWETWRTRGTAQRA